jgi:hypothetical protein
MTIGELETWFKNVELPKGPVVLYPGTTITDVPKFLDSHFIPLSLLPNSPTAHTHMGRLLALKSFIESQNERT